MIGLALLAQIMTLARTGAPPTLVQSSASAAESLRDLNAVGSVAKPLFNENLLAFELTSILLLVAIIGAVVLGKKRTVTS